MLQAYTEVIVELLTSMAIDELNLRQTEVVLLTSGRRMNIKYNKNKGHVMKINLITSN